MTTTNRARVARLLIVATLLSGLPIMIPAAALPETRMQAPGWITPSQDGDLRIRQGYSGGGGSGSGVSAQPASLLSALDVFRSNLIPTQTVRIALISSGVDTSSDSLPPTLTDAANLKIRGTLGDPVGYGTMAASALFQLFHGQSNVSITSYGVYPNGALDAGPGWLQWALSDVYNNAANFDVVLLAFPPTELLDPTSAGMNSGQWEKVIDIVS